MDLSTQGSSREPMAESDETLVSRTVRLKDTAAYGELVRRYEQKILMLQLRLTGERALAEDLSQETFLRAWQKLDTFSASGSFGGWLASLAYNVFRAHWRKHRRQKDEVALDDLELSAPAQDETGGADLDRLLGLLSRQDQVIMTLSYAYGLSNTEVGQVLDMPAGTIKARIHRAKAKIRALVENPTPAADSSPGSTPVPESSTADQTDDPKRKGIRWLGRKRAGQPFPANAVSTGSLTC
jgi:RNA polymerase sigma-70 factor (ECF subfamily)